MIPEQDLLEIMDAGRLAPTAGNFQPWEFIVAGIRKTIAALREATITGRNYSPPRPWLLPYVPIPRSPNTTASGV